eukprot:gene21529-27564_t
MDTTTDSIEMTTSTPVEAAKKPKIFHDWKSELNILLQRKGVLSADLKHHFRLKVSEVRGVNGPMKFQCLLEVDGMQLSVLGDVSDSKREAEQSAVESFLTSSGSRAAFEMWTPVLIDRGTEESISSIPMVLESEAMTGGVDSV